MQGVCQIDNFSGRIPTTSSGLRAEIRGGRDRTLLGVAGGPTQARSDSRLAAVLYHLATSCHLYFPFAISGILSKVNHRSIQYNCVPGT
jgi:hypothetical protein